MTRASGSDSSSSSSSSSVNDDNSSWGGATRGRDMDPRLIDTAVSSADRDYALEGFPTR